MYTANAKSTQTPKDFSEAPTISVVLPGWVSYLNNVFGPPEFLSRPLHTVPASFSSTGSILLSRFVRTQSQAW